MFDFDNIEAIIDRHRDYIERICMRAAWGDENVCTELVQRVFLALFDNRASLRPGADERQTKAWVKWMCRSTVSHWRRAQRRHRWVPLDEEHSLMAAPDDTADRELIDELAAHLPQRDRRLLDLVRQGYKPDEIAAIMGLSTANVHTSYSRIISRMRLIYEQITKQQPS